LWELLTQEGFFHEIGFLAGIEDAVKEGRRPGGKKKTTFNPILLILESINRNSELRSGRLWFPYL